MLQINYERYKNKGKLEIKSGSPKGIPEIIVQLRKEEKKKTIGDKSRGVFVLLKDLFRQLVYIVIRREL